MKLLTETIEVRGERFTVRELTGKSKAKWAEISQADRFASMYALVALTLVDPPMTQDEAGELSAVVIEALADCAMRLSEINVEKKG